MQSKTFKKLTRPKRFGSSLPFDVLTHTNEPFQIGAVLVGDTWVARLTIPCSWFGAVVWSVRKNICVSFIWNNTVLNEKRWGVLRQLTFHKHHKHLQITKISTRCWFFFYNLRILPISIRHRTPVSRRTAEKRLILWKSNFWYDILTIWKCLEIIFLP
jgi:hypothetical protein